MKGCLGSILSFIFSLLILLLLIKSGILAYLKPAFLLLVNLTEVIIKGITDVLVNGYTAPDYNQLFNL